MSGRSMDNSGEDTGSGDWRRRRRAKRTIPGATDHASTPATDQPKGDEPPVALSGTRSSFLEPSLNVIGSFSTPIVIVGIVALIAGGAVAGFVESMRTYAFIDIGIGGGLLLIVALIYESSVVAAFFSRTGRYGVNAAIMLVAFTGIIVVVNFVSFENNSRADVTATNQFSLHRTTKALLKELDEPVRATAFYFEEGIDAPDQIARRSKVEETFHEFEAIRSSKFEFRFIDPTLEPDMVRQYFESLPTLFVRESIVVEGLNSGITHVIQPVDAGYSKLEQDLFTAILVVSKQERKTIYFLAGHGERDVRTTAFGQDPQPEGYDRIRLGLEGDNYDVRTLRWNQLDEDVSVPDDPPEGCSPDDESCLPGAALLVIAGPTEELPFVHAQALDLFMRGKKLDEDGNIVNRREAARLIFLMEPDTPGSFLNYLFVWGVAIRPGYIRDLERSLPNLPRTLQLEILAPLDAPEEIRRSIEPATLDTLLGIISPRGESLGATRMIGAAPIMIRNDPNRASAPLAFTSKNSYFIDDLSRTSLVFGDEESDPKGPFAPVWYIEAMGPVASAAPIVRPPDNEIASMVVFGDSDFITNANVNSGSGADFFLNSANYLLGDYSLVSIRPKALTFREFKLNRNEYNFVRFSSWLFIPGLLGLMAAFVWWVRR